MASSVTSGAAGFEFGGEGVPGLFVRRAVIKFEQVGALAINTLMIMRLKNDPLLACCRVAATI